MAPAPVQPRPSRVPSVVNAVAGTLQVLVLLAALAVVCAHFAVGLGLQRVLSDSMRPTFAAGNHLVVVDRAPADLRVGDVPVLMFSDGSTRAHRIVDLHRTGGSVSVLTRGDANTVDDSWTDVADGRLVPVAVATLPAAPRNDEAFLVHAAVNRGRDAFRREAVRGASEDAGTIEWLRDCSPIQDEVLIAKARLDRVREGLDRLSPRTREIFLMQRLDGYKYREIAARLGISQSAVEKHMAKAMTFLVDWTEDW